MSFALLLSIFIHFEDKRNNNILNNSDEVKELAKEPIQIKYDIVNTKDKDDKISKNTDTCTINFSTTYSGVTSK